MEKEFRSVLEIVSKLEEIRKLPQFIFIDNISPYSTHEVRMEVLHFVKVNPGEKEIDFILESPGGSADDAYRIIRTLRNHFEKVNIIIPFWAKSAATLLTLGGSTIIMDEFGEFGPLDVQLKDDRDNELPEPETKSALIDEYSLSTIEKRVQELYRKMLLEIIQDKDLRFKKSNISEQLLTYLPSLYRPLLEKINPYEIGSKARDLAIGERYAERILTEFNRENMRDKIEYFIDYIVHDCPNHGYIIDYSVISQFLKNVYKASDIGLDYCRILTELSIVFFTNPGKYSHVGFFKKDLLESQSNIDNTNIEVNEKSKAEEDKNDERKDERRQQK